MRRAELGSVDIALFDAPLRKLIMATITRTFEVPGKPVGYYACGARPNWTRMKAYHAYKAKVQLFAVANGIPVPLTATKENPVVVDVTPYFANGVHCDPLNVQKGVADALFYKAKGGDKYSGGSSPPPLYDKHNPRVIVEVRYTT